MDKFLALQHATTENKAAATKSNSKPSDNPDAIVAIKLHLEQPLSKNELGPEQICMKQKRANENEVLCDAKVGSKDCLGAFEGGETASASYPNPPVPDVAVSEHPKARHPNKGILCAHGNQHVKG